MTKEQNQPTNQDLLMAINAFSTAVDKRFDGIDKKFEDVDKKLDSLDQRVGHLENHMVTKSYLDDRLANLQSDIMKEVRKEDAKIRAMI